jgi:hypothetical protein
VPKRLAHRFVFSGRSVVAARTRVQRERPVRVSPPLRGEGLLDINGCCGPSDHQEPPPVLDTAAGNRVVEDLGGGRFALYAHKQPGSVTVAVGQRVERGQVLGKVGNSGNSTEPHLHFHVMDGAGGASALGANGLPYVFDRFTLVGNIPDITKPVLVPAEHPRRRGQLPLHGDLVAF